MHPPGQLVQTVCPCHRDDPRNRQTYGADSKPQKGGPEVYPGLCTQIGRDDQVARPEKHGKQRKTDKQQLAALERLRQNCPLFPAPVPKLHRILFPVYTGYKFMSSIR